MDSIDFADNNLDVDSRKPQTEQKFRVEEQLVDFNYGSAQNQIEIPPETLPDPAIDMGQVRFVFFNQQEELKKTQN